MIYSIILVMKWGFIMSFIFGLTFGPLFFIITFAGFASLPIRIEALYYKEHIPKKRYFSSVTEFLVIMLCLGWAFYLMSENGFDTIYSYLFIFACLFVLGMIVYNQYQIRFKNKQRAVIKKIYYGQEGTSDKIDSFNKRNSSTTIKMSRAKAPVRLFIKAASKEEIDVLVDRVRSQTSLLKDLSEEKFKKRFYIYLGLYGLSVVYLVSLIVFQFTV